MSKQSYSSRVPGPSVDDRLLAALTSDLLKLYTEKTATDLTLEVQQRQFPAHRLILCARSPVFKAMLKSDMSEKEKNTVSISDLDEDTVDRLLRCLYTGVVQDLQWESALKLYYAGDEYQIGSLKDKCRDFIQSCLSASNVCEVLSLADTHADEDLKKMALDFIHDHEEEIFSSDLWENFIESRPHLAAKTMQHFIKSRPYLDTKTIQDVSDEDDYSDIGDDIFSKERMMRRSCREFRKWCHQMKADHKDANWSTPWSLPEGFRDESENEEDVLES